MGHMSMKLALPEPWISLRLAITVSSWILHSQHWTKMLTSSCHPQSITFAREISLPKQTQFSLLPQIMLEPVNRVFFYSVYPSLVWEAEHPLRETNS